MNDDDVMSDQVLAARFELRARIRESFRNRFGYLPPLMVADVVPLQFSYAIEVEGADLFDLMIRYLAQLKRVRDFDVSDDVRALEVMIADAWRPPKNRTRRRQTRKGFQSGKGSGTIDDDR